MRLFLNIIILSVTLIHMCCGEYSPLLPKRWEHEKRTTKSCRPTDAQMELITWYFERVNNYLEAIEIIPENVSGLQSKFTSYFLEHLKNYVHLKFSVFTIYYKYRAQKRDECGTNFRIYGWHDVNDQAINETQRTGQREEFARMKYAKHADRMDSPDSATIVLVESIETLDNYLNARTRHPFKHKRAHYVLLIYRETDSSRWDELAGRVLAKLWKNHGILNAIILSSCMPNNFGYYDPFFNVRELIVNDEFDKWGLYRSVPIESSLNFNKNWLIQKEYSLNYFPLTFTIFERYPTMVKNLPKYFAEAYYNKAMKISGYGGIDGLLLANLAEKMKFTILTIEPGWEETYGGKLGNGTFFGSLGDVVYGYADASFNGRFLQQYGTNDIEYMLPVLGDRVCLVAPAAEKHPQWKEIFLCFDLSVWIALIIITLVTSVVSIFVKLWQHTHQMNIIRETMLYSDYKPYVVESKSKFYLMFWTIWKVMIGVSTNMPNLNVERILIGSCLLANVIVIGSFESSLYTAYTKRSSYKNIETLAELDATDLAIIYYSQSYMNLFGTRGQFYSKTLLSLRTKIFSMDDDSEKKLHRTAYRRDVCSIERFSDVDIIIKTKYLDDDGSPLLNVIPECPRHYFLTYIVRKGWPFLPKFNQMLAKFSEAGLVHFWYDTTKEAFIRNRNIENAKTHYAGNLRKPFTLQDIQTSFYVLIFGHSIALIVFLIEMFVMPPKRINQSKIYFNRDCINKIVAQRWRTIFKQKYDKNSVI